VNSVLAAFADIAAEFDGELASDDDGADGS
jgi:hypothetical protein